MEIDITEKDTMGSIYRTLKEKMTREGEANIYDVLLRGNRHSSLEILEEKLKSAGNVREITDETQRKFDYEQMKIQYQGCLLERYISSFDNCRETVEKEALQIGTAAILEALGV